MRHVVSKLKDEDGYIYEGEYTYRGFDFRRDDGVSTGYYGRYKIDGHQGILRGFSSLRGLKRYVDNFLDDKDETNS